MKKDTFAQKLFNQLLITNNNHWNLLDYSEDHQISNDWEDGVCRRCDEAV